MQKKIIAIAAGAAVISSIALAIFIDSQPLAYTIIFVGGSGAAFYFFSVLRATLTMRTTFSLAILTWVIWTASAVVYGVRSLQVAPLIVCVVAVVALIAAVALLWERLIQTARTLTHLHVLLGIEGAIVLFFATTSFFILGALNALWFVAIGLLLRAANAGAEAQSLWRIAAWCGACIIALVLFGQWYL